MEETATGVVVTLVLGRKILNEILTTYLPTSLLIIIVHSTNYYKDFFFEAIVTVNLTGHVLKLFKLVSFVCYRFACVVHHVCECVRQPPCDQRYQDDRGLAHLQSLGAFYRGVITGAILFLNKYLNIVTI